jgi:hypothetical protein
MTDVSLTIPLKAPPVSYLLGNPINEESDD